MREAAMTDTVVIASEGEENAGYKFSWGLAFAGAFAATAVTFFLLTIGAGFGLLLVNPVTHTGPTLPVFLTGGAIYFFAAQAFGFAVGGHLVGRLLGPIVETQAQEDFRAGAHGLTVWAITVVASLLLVAVAGLTAVHGGSIVASMYGASTADSSQASTPTNYLVDQLFRPAGDSAPEGARLEAGRLVDASFAKGSALSDSDDARLVALVSRNAGISRDDASARVDAIAADTKSKIERAANVARKAASYSSLWIGFSLLFGAIVSIFAAVTARVEDDKVAGLRL
jgi:hypothetical protein